MPINTNLIAYLSKNINYWLWDTTYYEKIWSDFLIASWYLSQHQRMWASILGE